MKSNFKVALSYIVVIIILIAITVALINGQSKEEAVYSDIVAMFKNQEVSEFKVSNANELTVITKDKKTVVYSLRSLDVFRDDVTEYIKAADEAGNSIKYEYEPPTTFPWWVSLLPYAIVLGVVIVVWIVFMNQMGGGKGSKINSFGKARAKVGADEKKKVFFTDVAGADEEKEELREVVDYLKDPKKFSKLGARIPRGVLLVGPPGTGKTLLAKAVAGEAGVPFYSISGSDFVEMYVGVGASRVRDLFDTARKNNASIIFIDEIDAVGRHRGAGLGGGHDEREQTLNQLLVEMDGFGTHEGVIVMAATNRPDILDPALLRPGRFDRQITVHYPDLNGRVDILKVHSKNKPLENDVDLREIAKTTIGFTGADLANLLNEAALLAARKNKHLIGMTDIEEAMIKIIVGTAKKTSRRNAEETKMTAYHEAGHAIVHHALQTLDPVQQISIVPTARTGGYTLSAPTEDKFFMSMSKMKDEIVALLGGRVAEKIIFKDFTTGASNDIQKATSIAKNMVTKYGMSEKLGSIVYGSEHDSDEVFLGRDFSNSKNYSEDTAATIDSEIRLIVDEAYARCEEILTRYIDKLHFIADYLVNNEIMDAAQFKATMEGNPTAEELDEMVAEKRRKSEEENKAKEEAERIALEKDIENEKKREEKQQHTPLNPFEEYRARMKEERENKSSDDKSSDDDHNDK